MPECLFSIASPHKLSYMNERSFIYIAVILFFRSRKKYEIAMTSASARCDKHVSDAQPSSLSEVLNETFGSISPQERDNIVRKGENYD